MSYIKWILLYWNVLARKLARLFFAGFLQENRNSFFIRSTFPASNTIFIAGILKLLFTLLIRIGETSPLKNTCGILHINYDQIFQHQTHLCYDFNYQKSDQTYTYRASNHPQNTNGYNNNHIRGFDDSEVMGAERVVHEARYAASQQEPATNNSQRSLSRGCLRQ